MLEAQNTKTIKIFGDFQTPENFSIQVLRRVQKCLPFQPRSILEPTCGKGSFLFAATNIFPTADSYTGIEINKSYLQYLRHSIYEKNIKNHIDIINADFFSLDWNKVLASLIEPVLITGNPPWVTNSNISAVGGSNLPAKNNFQSRNGLEAITGKANFDISEWMILKYLEWLEQKHGALAILCKTHVARKILAYAWKHKKPIGSASIYKIDALAIFGAAVDACLFVAVVGSPEEKQECRIYKSIDDELPSQHISYKDNMILANIDNYTNLSFLKGASMFYTWRSGIKHDCSRVMELTINGDILINGIGEEVTIEDDYLYPLLKSSDLGNERIKMCRKRLIVTQRFIGEDTNSIKMCASLTWKYLQSHVEALASRKSSIYRSKPTFSIFGVGEYSFAPWKVAISSLYKSLKFFSVGPMDNKPVVFDDTVYFLPCDSEKEARFICELLNSYTARLFLESFIFWNDKRPITIDILKRLSIENLVKYLNREDEWVVYTDNEHRALREVG
ncbi:N-6 DNA methylase [Rickettsia endosymbiont of Ceutorhynchus obstrictus]|uniref:N-6 DNA methylase n=1 Tax=Rickettsia endosymbiont of Ceutorhynchus obstrictus TaxID=3066249 RepID=UPI00313337B6